MIVIFLFKQRAYELNQTHFEKQQFIGNINTFCSQQLMSSLRLQNQIFTLCPRFQGTYTVYETQILYLNRRMLFFVLQSVILSAFSWDSPRFSIYQDPRRFKVVLSQPHCFRQSNSSFFEIMVRLFQLKNYIFEWKTF